MGSGLKKLLITIVIIVVLTTIFSIVQHYHAQKKYKEQIEKLQIALKLWVEKNQELLPKKSGEAIVVPLRTLKQSGLIETRFVNPKERMNFSNQLLMKIEKKGKNYQYKILDQDENMIKDYDDINKKAPMIILKGSEVTYAELNHDYEDAGYEAITLDGKKEDEVKIEITTNGKAVSKVDTSKLGTYQFTYHVSYAKEKSSITRIVVVKDTEKPTIEMERLILEPQQVKSANLLEDITIKDNSNDPLNIEVIGSLSAYPGRYVLTYKVTDASGNFTEKKRIVRVEESLAE